MCSARRRWATGLSLQPCQGTAGGSTRRSPDTASKGAASVCLVLELHARADLACNWAATHPPPHTHTCAQPGRRVTRASVAPAHKAHRAYAGVRSMRGEGGSGGSKSAYSPAPMARPLWQSASAVRSVNIMWNTGCSTPTRSTSTRMAALSSPTRACPATGLAFPCQAVYTCPQPFSPLPPPPSPPTLNPHPGTATLIACRWHSRSSHLRSSTASSLQPTTNDSSSPPSASASSCVAATAPPPP